MYSYEYQRDKINNFFAEYEEALGSAKHFHNCMELVYAVDGESIVHIDGDIYRISSGQMSICAPFSTHYYETVRNGKFIIVIIPRRCFREYEHLFNNNNFSLPIITDGVDRPIYSMLVMAYKMYHEKDIFDEPLPKNSAYKDDSLHYLSLYLVNLCINHCGLKERRRISSLVADAVGIIEDDFRKDIKICDICKRLNINQKELSGQFKKTMGVSILDYVDNMRVLEAARLLSCDGNMLIDAVMLQSGFGSQRSFLRHFKNTFGCTPSEFKMQINKQQ